MKGWIVQDSSDKSVAIVYELDGYLYHCNWSDRLPTWYDISTDNDHQLLSETPSIKELLANSRAAADTILHEFEDYNTFIQKHPELLI